MGVKISAFYEGELHTSLTHGPSGSVLPTDAPKDNQGKGEAFSPTDLTAASLLSCMITTMGIAAKKNGISIEGTTGEVEKEMIADPDRRIAKLTVKIRMVKGLTKDQRRLLEDTALGCPITKSISDRIDAPTTFSYPD